MRKSILFLSCAILGCLTAAAQTPTVIDLWPDGAPNSSGLTGEEYRNENNRITNVTKPTLTVFPAKNPNGMAVIACPGGGYSHLSFEHEGTDMAAWYNAMGITYAVLKYRMPNGHMECPTSDMVKAMEIMHAHAAEWGVSDSRIGVQGNSAGGHLASWISTHFSKDSERPAFQILFYPGMGSGGMQPNDQLVTADTPPAFIMVSADDGLRDQSIRYFQALRSAGVDACLHIYPNGGHGWGFRDDFTYKRQWTGEVEKWLSELARQLPM